MIRVYSQIIADFLPNLSVFPERMNLAGSDVGVFVRVVGDTTLFKTCFDDGDQFIALCCRQEIVNLKQFNFL